MMSGHKDPKTVMRYDHHRESLEQNAVTFLNYDELKLQSDRKECEETQFKRAYLAGQAKTDLAK